MARVPEIIRRNSISHVAVQPAETGQGFRALAAVAKMGEEFIEPLALEKARQSGEKAVYRDDDGNLKVDTKSVLSGRHGAAHNSAALASYMSKKQVDFGQTMSELSIKHQFDPAGFKDATDAYLKLQDEDENIPDVLKADLRRQAEQESARRFNGLRLSEINRTQKDADVNTKTARDMLMDDYVSLVVDGDDEAAAEKMIEIEANSQFRADAPFIRETPAQTEAYLRGARGTAKAARLIRDLSELDGATEISDSDRADLESVLKDPDISPRVRQQLYTATQGRLKGIDAAGLVKGFTDSSYEAMTVRRESGGNNAAQNPNSSAYGPHQFLKGTWSALVKKYKPEWARGLSEGQMQSLRGDRAKSSEMFQHFRRENQAALSAAGLPIDNGTEYMAHFFGAGGAVDVLSADPNTPLSEIVTKATMDANPHLRGKTAHWARNWANRTMTMKASDMANMATQVNEIPDLEVRGMAARDLANKIKVQKDLENAAASVFEERFASGDTSLTTQEIMEDHSLATADQVRLSKALEKQNEAQVDLAGAVARLTDENVHFDPNNAADRKDVDRVFDAAAGEGDPLQSQEAKQAATEINRAKGFLPSGMYDALRTASTSSDPAVLGSAMEDLGGYLADSEGALGNRTGKSGLLNTFSDYSFFAQHGTMEEAAQRTIDAQDAPKNKTDQAKKLAENREIGEVIDHFDKSWFSDPNIGDVDAGEVMALMTDDQSNEMMSEFKKLFQAAFLETGSEALATNRALNNLGRSYAVNQITGDGRLMKFPPQSVYRPIGGSFDWMSEQAEAEVSTLAFGDEADIRGKSRASSRNWVRKGQIKLVSDATTRKQVLGGQPASYILYYKIGDEVHQAPQRFVFDPTEAKAAERARFDADRAAATDQSARTNYFENVEKFGKERADEMIREEEGGSSAVPR